jgi:hypothetical protein
MFMCDAPIPIDLAQAHGQPEQETVLVRRIAGRVWTAPHDRFAAVFSSIALRLCASFDLKREIAPRPSSPSVEYWSSILRALRIGPTNDALWIRCFSAGLRDGLQ